MNTILSSFREKQNPQLRLLGSNRRGGTPQIRSDAMSGNDFQQPAKSKLILFSLIIAVLLSAFMGCAVYRASNQPSKRDLRVLRPGTPRDNVIAELGAPVFSEVENGCKKEIFTFVQGYSKMTDAGRALFHGAADVFTIGLWEAVGTPIEGAFDGKRISVRVLFDSDATVRESATLKVEDPGAK